MQIPHEAISVIGSVVGQIFHIVKKKTEEEPTIGEAGIFTRYILRRPINTLAAALTGAGAAIGLTSGETAAVMGQLNTFLAAVIAGIAANSVVNRPGE